jgi:hypothetical protein
LILEEIKTKLEEIDPNTFYGMADSKRMKDKLWNYIVFERTSLKWNQNRTSYTPMYSVHVIREEFIPEGLEEAIINKMLEIDGMKLAGTEGTYTYTPKPNTNVVIEMFTVDFVKPKKA